MWRVIIQCSAEGWRKNATAFNAIADKYSGTPISSKKMKDDERRIMEYQIENVSDAEDFVADCLTLEDFTATFESL
ncbi:hypothetical protein H6G89_12310 [Oscillatoria sp. FACHB-1407]|uniref:hypothetical protein n=1 Tax=Oscillatoria sp. FACHB-1407 TaxID=2692847 RepID=UPI0016874569|nr:hypothetical protein [Oscillatoria sp. FACHB-1407]MBD2461832.1 hypothetical protein [Oscillatoria sp. FACHB-1407]